jgi:hypothetical protein
MCQSSTAVYVCGSMHTLDNLNCIAGCLHSVCCAAFAMNMPACKYRYRVPGTYWQEAFPCSLSFVLLCVLRYVPGKLSRSLVTRHLQYAWRRHFVLDRAVVVHLVFCGGHIVCKFLRWCVLRALFTLLPEEQAQYNEPDKPYASDCGTDTRFGTSR